MEIYWRLLVFLPYNQMQIFHNCILLLKCHHLDYTAKMVHLFNCFTSLITGSFSLTYIYCKPAFYTLSIKLWSLSCKSSVMGL